MAKLSPLGITHFKITLGDESAAGLFKTVSPQGASVDHDYFPYNSEAGPPVKAWVPTGGHVNYQEPITLERGLDPDKRLWQWINTVMREYDPESSMREMTIEYLNYKNASIAKFKATGVWPSSYKTTDWNASGGSKVAIESLGLSLETWERF
jgi:phage tail-like protein